MEHLIGLLAGEGGLGVLALAWTILSATVGGILVVIRWLVERRDKNLEIGREEASKSSGVQLTIQEYEANLRLRVAEVAEQFRSVADDRKSFFEAQLTVLQAKLDNIEPAYQKALGRIVELEKLVSTTANFGTSESLAAGLHALQNSKFDSAQENFKVTLSELEPLLNSASVAAYGLGLIAEERVDWIQAAKYFQLSCIYNPNEDNLLKSSIYLWRAGLFAEAAEKSLELKNLYGRKYGENSPEFAGILNNLGAQMYELGQVDEAIKCFENAQHIHEAHNGAKGIDFAASLANLGNVYIYVGDLKKALQLHRRALRVAEKAGIRQDARYSTLLNGLAETLRLNKRYDESERYFKRAIKVDEASFGTQHPFYARDLYFFSKLLLDKKNFSEASKQLDRALELSRIQLGEGHPHTLHMLNLLIFALMKLKKTKFSILRIQELKSKLVATSTSPSKLDARSKYFWQGAGIIQRIEY